VGAQQHAQALADGAGEHCSHEQGSAQYVLPARRAQYAGGEIRSGCGRVVAYDLQLKCERSLGGGHLVVVVCGIHCGSSQS
jgi:hypothetical protein